MLADDNVACDGRVVDDALPHTAPAPAERLGQWLDWSRAVALSRALDAKAPEAALAAADVLQMESFTGATQDRIGLFEAAPGSMPGM